MRRTRGEAGGGGGGAAAAGLTGRVPLQLPEGPQQTFVALVALVVLSVEQQLLGIRDETRDSGEETRTSLALPVGPRAASSC